MGAMAGLRGSGAVCDLHNIPPSATGFRGLELQLQCSLSSSSVAAMKSGNFLAFLSLPQALNQHPIGPIDVIRSLAFSICVGCVMYLVALWTFWFHGLFSKRRSLRTSHRASTVIGLAFVLIPQTMYLQLILPGNVGGMIEVGLMIAIFVVALVVAFRVLGRDEAPSEAGSI